jgi:peptidoglycan/LPS O-acetylase OafA/YrhL
MVGRFLIAGGLAVGLAAISRRYYEDPILRLKDRLAPSEQRKTAGEIASNPSGDRPEENTLALSNPQSAA